MKEWIDELLYVHKWNTVDKDNELKEHGQICKVLTKNIEQKVFKKQVAEEY